MDEILDEKEGSPNKNRITPFLIIGLLVMLISGLMILSALFSELTGQGSKGTFTLLLLASITVIVTMIILFFEGKLLTNENRKMVVWIEVIVIIFFLINLYN